MYHAALFEQHAEAELFLLERELIDGTYRPGKSICFVVTEPTVREIFAASFRDRVVHHLLYDALSPIFEPLFIHQSYACRLGKGTRRAVTDVQRSLRILTGNNRKAAYCLHLDIRGFFMSLKKDILFRLIEKRIHHPDLLWLASVIIFHDPLENFMRKGDAGLFALVPPYKSLFGVARGEGLPIGNLTSQFFANVYLNELDQYAKHRLKVRHYFRYVDDLLLLSHDPDELLAWRDRIEAFLQNELKLELHPKKQKLCAVSQGIDWLGYIVAPDHVLVRRRVVKRFRKTLLLLNKKLAESTQPASGISAAPPRELLEHILASVNSSFGHFVYANSFHLRTCLWEKHFGSIRQYIEPTDAKLRVFRIIEQDEKKT
ncbi:MAG: RNA-directed DNA polymerase [Candidatus Peregrinibacteria bacterium]